MYEATKEDGFNQQMQLAKKEQKEDIEDLEPSKNKPHHHPSFDIVENS